MHGTIEVMLDCVMVPHVCQMVCRSSVYHNFLNFLKGREVILPCSYRSTFYSLLVGVNCSRHGLVLEDSLFPVRVGRPVPSLTQHNISWLGAILDCTLYY